MKYWTSGAFVENPRDLPAIAQACEEAGFEGIILPDHLVLPHDVNTYPYTPDGSPRWPEGTPWPDPWVAIASMAAVTERLRFTTGVYVLPVRNVFVTAKAVATAAVISDNRVILGAGAGWCEREYELGEQPFRRRGARMEEIVPALRALWSDFDAAYEGDHVRFAEVDVRPLPTEPVPILARRRQRQGSAACRHDRRRLDRTRLHRGKPPRPCRDVTSVPRRSGAAR